MSNTLENKEIAQTILQQLGGNKFIVMTGSKNLSFGDRCLNMQLTQNKAGAKWLQISLDWSDTYTMLFRKSKKVTVPGQLWKDEKIVEVKKIEGVYCEQLQELFTDVTGLYTSLGTLGR